MTVLPDTQLALRPGIAEVWWSNPDPVLPPAAELAEGARRSGALVRRRP